jgi:hypothetical protein
MCSFESKKSQEHTMDGEGSPAAKLKQINLKQRQLYQEINMRKDVQPIQPWTGSPSPMLDLPPAKIKNSQANLSI